MPLNLCRSVIYWYHSYLNRPGGIRLSNTTRQVCYWKGLVTQEDISIKKCKKCQQFKNRNTLYGHLSPKIVTALKLWNSVHIGLIGPYYKSIIQHHPAGAIINKDVSLTCMIIIDPVTGWFKIVKVYLPDLDDVARGNN